RRAWLGIIIPPPRPEKMHPERGSCRDLRRRRDRMETSVSLLERLQTQPDEAAWQRLDRIYRPLIRAWVLRDPALRQDADDLAQEVMSVLVRELPRFRRQLPGSFRAWLRAVT